MADDSTNIVTITNTILQVKKAVLQEVRFYIVPFNVVTLVHSLFLPYECFLLSLFYFRFVFRLCDWYDLLRIFLIYYDFLRKR